MAGNSTYRDISQQHFNSLTQPGTAGYKVIVFNADWLGSGQMLDEIIEDTTKSAADVFEFYRVNADQYPELIAEFGIQVLPSVLVFQGGEVCSVLTGLPSQKKISNTLDELLDDEEE